MAIGTAVQSGGIVYIYDERGNMKAQISVTTGGNDGLKGFSGSTVSIQQGTLLYTYDEYGNQLGVVLAG